MAKSEFKFPREPQHPGQIHWDLFRDYDFNNFRTEYFKLYPKHGKYEILNFRHKRRYSPEDMELIINSTSHLVSEDYWWDLWSEYNLFLDKQDECDHVWLMSTNENKNDHKSKEYDHLAKKCILCLAHSVEKFNQEARKLTDIKFEDISSRTRWSVVDAYDQMKAACDRHLKNNSDGK